MKGNKMNKEFVMRYMVEYGLDAEVPPSELTSIGFDDMMYKYLQDRGDGDVTSVNFTRGLIALRFDGWINCKFDPFKISLTQKSKDLLKSNDVNKANQQE